MIERLSKRKHGADLFIRSDSSSDVDLSNSKGPACNEESGTNLLDDLMTAQGRFYYAIVDKDSGKAWGHSLSCGSIQPTG